MSTVLFVEESFLEGVFEMKINLSGRNHQGERFVVLLALFVLAIGLSPAARAQDVKGGIRGTVSDEQGAAVAGVEVTITDPATGLSRRATTGGDGVYNFPDLPLGTFNIHVAHPGFKASEETGIALHAADSLVFNIVLRIGAVTEHVTVEASAIHVETTNGGVNVKNGMQNWATRQ